MHKRETSQMANFTIVLGLSTPWVTQNHHELQIALFLVLTIPILLHYAIYRPKSHKTPSILLLGPTDSGKTSLLALLERGHSVETHTTQTSVSVELSFLSERVSDSNKYRSKNDPFTQTHKKYYLIDTPGHAKLRHIVRENVTNLQNLTGIVFVVNAARLRVDDDFTRQTADYLYELLLLLRKRLEKPAGSENIPVLIAANKMDLFTAIPTEFVQKNLESEFTRIRSMRMNSIPGTEISVDDTLVEGWDDWLGNKESSTFQFSQLKEFDNISVDFLGGNINGDKPNIKRWREWIAERL